MQFVTIGIVVVAAAAAVIAEINALTMASMVATYDHFVAASQTIDCCSNVVVEANRLQSFHRDQLIIDANRWSQCAHPINNTGINLFKSISHSARLPYNN